MLSISDWRLWFFIYDDISQFHISYAAYLYICLRLDSNQRLENLSSLASVNIHTHTNTHFHHDSFYQTAPILFVLCTGVIRREKLGRRFLSCFLLSVDIRPL